MAISKRMRFEILRRDKHTCRYCGQATPDVKLAVDHVLPTALGGTDDPNNLVTACTDCNNGKTSTSPDSELVADIDNHALLMQAAYAKAVEARNKKRTHVGARINSAIDYWNEVAPTYYQTPIDAKSTPHRRLRAHRTQMGSHRDTPPHIPAQSVLYLGISIYIGGSL